MTPLKMSSRSVRKTDSAREGRQPMRFEKKNTAAEYPGGGVLTGRPRLPVHQQRAAPSFGV
jgi:hypothetical protein